MKFIADGMMGKVSRWLRILGYDVKYENDALDDTILKIAVEERRILLTRDSELLYRARADRVEAFFVEGKLEERLAEIAQQFKIKLDIDVMNSRCPLCGSRLDQIERKKVINRVPKRSLKHFHEFWLCTRCDKVYWQGTHWKNINQTLNKAKRLLNNKRTVLERELDGR